MTLLQTSGRPSGSAASGEVRGERRKLTQDLLMAADRARRSGDSEERRRLLHQVVVHNMGVAATVASRYRRRGVPDEDLEQVAYLALVMAARGYDPEAGTDFLSYAVPTIRGEVKKHFRDLAWTVRPPRRVQELQARIAVATSELSHELARSPRPSELARHLGEALEDVTEALATDGCFAPASLDRVVSPDGHTTLGDLVGAEDPGQHAAEARVMLIPLVQSLPERDRRIVILRFIHGLTQLEIADELGVTQMQVSRLLTRILRDLRAGLMKSGSRPIKAEPAPTSSVRDRDSHAGPQCTRDSVVR